MFHESLRVIRVDPKTKRPLRADWANHTHAWSPLVAGWDGWAAPTGPVNGYWCLDVDAKSGGFESLRKLEAQYGRLPVTRITRTKSGGMHLWFAWDASRPVATTVGRLPGLDTRGAGGYVVIPPTAGYTWGTYDDCA